MEQPLQVLKQNYLRNRTLPSMFGPALAIDQSYINLAMIQSVNDKKEEQNQSEKEGEQKETKNKLIRDERLSSFEDLFGEKYAIAIQDLFKSQEKDQQKTPCLILIEGRAGIGKTTFTTYVCHQWATGQLFTQFDWVFKITLRRLTQVSAYQKSDKDFQIKDIIFHECFPEMDRNDFDVFWKSLEQLPAEKKLFLLDGYDEIATITGDPSHPLAPVLERILSGDYPVILTSRPYGLSSLPLDRRNIEIIGFTNDNIEKYIEQFYASSMADNDQAQQQSQSLLQFLKANPSIWGSAHIPIQLNLICGIYGEHLQTASRITMTTLYQQIELKLLDRAYQEKSVQKLAISQLPEKRKKEHLQAHFNLLLRWLGEVALRGLEQESLIISGALLDDALERTVPKEAPLETYGHLRQLNRYMGLLRMVGDSQQETSQKYEFIHLTFQEYFAARYLAAQLTQAHSGLQYQTAQDFIRTHKFNPRYQIVWWFVAGLLRENSAILQLYFKTLLAPPQDLIGGYSLCLIMRCLDESGVEALPENLWQPIVDQIREQLKIDVIVGACKYNYDQDCNSILWNYLELSPYFKKLPYFYEALHESFIRELENKNWDIRKAAIKSLGKIGQATPSVIEALSRILRDESSYYFREYPIKSLGELGQAAPAMIVPLLMQVLESNNYCQEIVSVVHLLKKLDQVSLYGDNIANILLKKLGDEDSYRRAYVAEALGKLEQATPHVIDSLTQALEDKYDHVRKRAVYSLKELGKATPSVINALVQRLEDFNPFIQSEAEKALISLGRKSPSMVNASVIEALVKMGDRVSYFYSSRPYISNVLVSLGQEIPLILDVLLQMFKDKACGKPSTTVVLTLGKLGQATPAIIMALIQALKNEDSYVRRVATFLLGELGQVTPSVIEALIRVLLEDESQDVRRYATEALGKLNQATSAVIEALFKALQDEKWYYRACAAEMLVKLGQPALDVIEALIQTLRDKNARMYSLPLLEKLSKTTFQLTDIFFRVLNDENSSTRYCVGSLLGKLGHATPTIVEVLIQALGDEDSAIRMSAVETLGKLEQTTPAVIAALLKAFEDKNPCVRESVIVSLGKLGQTNPSIIYCLIQTLEENKQLGSYHVRSVAFSSLSHLINSRQLSEKLALKNIKEQIIFLYAFVRKQTLDKTVISLKKAHDEQFLLSTYENKQRKEISLNVKQAKLLHYFLPKICQAIQNYQKPDFDQWLADYQTLPADLSWDVFENFQKPRRRMAHYELTPRLSLTEVEQLKHQTGIELSVPEGEAQVRVVLGKGAFGKFRLARDAHNGQFVGVKKIKGEAMGKSKQECLIHSEISGLPNILPLLYETTTRDSNNDPAFYQFMPLGGFGDGEKLGKQLQLLRDSELKRKIMRHVAKGLLTGIGALHAKYMTHMDTKPNNFVLTIEGMVYVIDFGCVLKFHKNHFHIPKEASQKGSGDSFIYSPERMAYFRRIWTQVWRNKQVTLPPQLSLETADSYDAEKADAWSLGITLLQLLIGRHPFGGPEKNFDYSQWDEKLFDNGKFKPLEKPFVYNLVRWDSVFMADSLRAIYAPLDQEAQHWSEEDQQLWVIIKNLLTIDPQHRLTVREALQDPLFSAEVFNTRQERETVFRQLKALQPVVLKDTLALPVKATLPVKVTTAPSNDNDNDEEHYAGDIPPAAAASLPAVKIPATPPAAKPKVGNLLSPAWLALKLPLFKTQIIPPARMALQKALGQFNSQLEETFTTTTSPLPPTGLTIKQGLFKSPTAAPARTALQKALIQFNQQLETLTAQLMELNGAITLEPQDEKSLAIILDATDGIEEGFAHTLLSQLYHTLQQCLPKVCDMQLLESNALSHLLVLTTKSKRDTDTLIKFLQEAQLFKQEALASSLENAMH